jgi:hypothetical protein
MAIKPTVGHIDWIGDDAPAKYIEPSAAKKLQGWIGSEKPPYQYFNWVFRLIDRWLKWSEAQSDENAAAIAANVVAIDAEVLARANAYNTILSRLTAVTVASSNSTEIAGNQEILDIDLGNVTAGDRGIVSGSARGTGSGDNNVSIWVGKKSGNALAALGAQGAGQFDKRDYRTASGPSTNGPIDFHITTPIEVTVSGTLVLKMDGRATVGGDAMTWSFRKLKVLWLYKQ